MCVYPPPHVTCMYPPPHMTCMCYYTIAVHLDIDVYVIIKTYIYIYVCVYIYIYDGDMIVVSKRHNNTRSRIIYQQSGRTKSLFEAHGSRHPTRRRRCLWWWWRGGGVVGIGFGGGSRRSGEEEAGGRGRRQHHALVCGVYWSWLLKPWRLIPQVVVAALGMNGHGIEYHWQ